MAGAEGVPVGPVGVKVRDPDVWWPYESVVSRIEGLKTGYPRLVDVETIGHSVKGRPLYKVHLGRTDRCIAIIGAIHAGEAGPEIALGAADLLLAESSELLEKVGIAIIPVANVDEREREVTGTPWYLRVNASGVDLNRNFPSDWHTIEYGYGINSADPTSVTYRGATPGSEPETQAIMSALKATSPAAVFAFHCLASICGMGFITVRDADAAYAARCRELAVTYIEGSGIAVPADKTCGLVCTSGSLPAWCWSELGVPGFDLEISADAEPEAYMACKPDKTDAELVSRYQRFHADGLKKVLAGLA